MGLGRMVVSGGSGAASAEDRWRLYVVTERYLGFLRRLRAGSVSAVRVAFEHATLGFLCRPTGALPGHERGGSSLVGTPSGGDPPHRL